MLKNTRGLKKSERIKGREAFRRLFKEGGYFKSANFSLRTMPNSLGPTRLGISVKKEVFKHAAHRNRIKRLIREAFRQHKDEFKKGCELLLRPKNKNVLMIQYRDIEKEILELANTAGVLAK